MRILKTRMGLVETYNLKLQVSLKMNTQTWYYTRINIRGGAQEYGVERS